MIYHNEEIVNPMMDPTLHNITSSETAKSGVGPDGSANLGLCGSSGVCEHSELRNGSTFFL